MSESGQILVTMSRTRDMRHSQISHGNITSEWELPKAGHYLHLPEISQE